jgi:hypothetical protein
MALAEAQDGGKITFSENLCAAALSCEIFTGGLEIGRFDDQPCALHGGYQRAFRVLADHQGTLAEHH